MSSLIDLKNVNKVFDDGGVNELVVFDQLNWQLQYGQSISIQGTSGSGKTTFLHLISGLDKPTEGQVYFENQDFEKLSDSHKSKIRNQSIGFVYQFHHLVQEFKVVENITLPIKISRKVNHEDNEWVDYLLQRLGIFDKKYQYPSSLSGGQRQRVAIARSLVNRPKCLIADEPTGNLDQKNAEKIGDILIELQKEQNSALIIATHDNTLAAKCWEKYEIRDKSLMRKAC